MDVQDIEIDTFRFFIRDEKDNKRSSTWYIKNTGDSVYLFVNYLGRFMKATFHPKADESVKDGKDSQYGFTDHYRSKLSKESYVFPDPHRWKRPRPSLGKDVRVAKILFPHDHLKNVLVDDREDYKREPYAKRKWRLSLPMAGTGGAVEVSLIYSFKKPQELEEAFVQRGFTPMYIMKLPCGESALVTGRNVVFNSKSLPSPSNHSRARTIELDGLKNIGDYEENLCATYSNTPQDGQVLRLAEVSGFSLQRTGCR